MSSEQQSDQELTARIIASAGPNKYYNLFRFRVRRWRGGGGSGFSFKVYVSVKERLQVPRFIVFFQVTGLYFFFRLLVLGKGFKG
jgi:hypothetical protein